MRVDPNSSATSLVPWFKSLASEDSLEEAIGGSAKEQQKHTISELVDQVNTKLEESGTHIQVKVHEKTNTIMVVVLKDDSNEIVREIPSEKMLDMMYNISRKAGIFLDEKM
ncbi:flagellar protein FlaG [Paenibacillus terreus]|uniref:Flagellar protein FlaG n=1 Tax=Paenibacillus terreus TaxID=1387834 RepID=A0ABV5B9X9_9BACL